MPVLPTEIALLPVDRCCCCCSSSVADNVINPMNFGRVAVALVSVRTLTDRQSLNLWRHAELPAQRWAAVKPWIYRWTNLDASLAILLNVKLLTWRKKSCYCRFRSDCFNPLESRGNYSATSNNMKLVHWPLTGRLLHLVQLGGDWAGPQPAQAPPRCTKCNSPPVNGQCSNYCIAV